VACATSKTIVNDLCLVFKGGQGIGKSTWFKRLLPVELEEYYTTFNISDKSNDTALSIISSLILDMDELNDLSKREDTEIKQLISQKQFKIRKPYDRLPDTYYRFASFCGSVNEDTFLKDATGHRRYIVIDVKTLDFDVMRTYDKHKIWSQAVAMFKAGFQFWLSQEENAELSSSNKQYEVVTPESELLTARFKPADKDGFTHRLNTSQLLQFLDIKKLDQRGIKSMKNALKENGFESHIYWIDGKSQRLYSLYELTKSLL
jgi:predicted P-loop ATPase